MKKLILLFLAAISCQVLLISKVKAFQMLPLFFCHDTTLTYSIGPETTFNGLYALQIPSTYTSGDVLRIEFQNQITDCTLTAFGAFPVLTGLTDLGPACYSPPAFTSSLTITYPVGACTSGGYFEFYIHVNLFNHDPLIINLFNLAKPNPCDSIPIPCKDCLPSFSPQPDSTYIISAWVSESPYSITTTTFSEPVIKISYEGSGQTEEFHASGQIIDGWQRVEGIFTVPHTATLFNLILEPGGIIGWFDDIRIYPQRGSMKTYVFDPVNLRLDAELDERNYATIYEYDEEGHLTRVKKETERGIMTIQENKTATAK